METFNLILRTPDDMVYSGKASFITLRAVDGELGIGPRHTSLITALEPCTLFITDEKAERKRFFIGGGLLEVYKGTATVLSESVEDPEVIDVDRAHKARERAMDRLREKAEDVNLSRAELALKRAIYRLKTAEI